MSNINIGATATAHISLKGRGEYTVFVPAGKIVEVDARVVKNEGNFQPKVEVYDEASKFKAIDINEDSNGTASVYVGGKTDATYNIRVSDWGDDGSGDYSIAVKNASPPPLNEAIDTGTTIRSFNPSGATKVVFSFEAGGQTIKDRDGNFVTIDWTAEQRTQIQKAMASISAVADIEFVAATGSQDSHIKFHAGSLQNFSNGGTFTATLGLPGTENAGVGLFNVKSRGWGDGHLNEGSFAFQTIIHEILHGLGLAHPHDQTGASSIMPGVTGPRDKGLFDLNQDVNTVMSYNSYIHPVKSDGIPVDVSYGFATGPMALDIAVLQKKYGENVNHESGRNLYKLEDYQGKLASIWDAGGFNSILTDSGRDAVIDLRPAELDYKEHGGGYLSSLAGLSGGFTIAQGTKIYNVLTGEGNHRVTGNDLNNAIVTSSGNDIIEGGRGNDILDGAAGADTFVFNVGDGHDTIISFWSEGMDKIQMRGMKFSDLTIKANGLGGSDIHYGNGDQISVGWDRLSESDFIF